MLWLITILLVAALLILLAAAFNWPAVPPRVNLIALGLALYMLTLVISRHAAA